MAGIHPHLVQIADRALEISSHRKGGIDFAIPQLGGRRSALQQLELFQAGVSKADGKEKRSKHQDGLALDIVPLVDGVVPWEDEAAFYKVAVCVLQAGAELGIPVQWGGNWRNWTDLPHFELV